MTTPNRARRFRVPRNNFTHRHWYPSGARNAALAILTLLFAPVMLVAEPDGAAALFVKRCAGCHTIGGGKLSGPDLKNCTAWPLADRANKVTAMQKQAGALSPGEIDALATFVGNPQAQARVAEAIRQFLVQNTAKLDPPSATYGEALYRGGAPLGAGGMACISCHEAGGGGGALGPNLHGVSGRLGKAALLSGIQNASWKVMKGHYGAHPVTAQEAAHLSAFLETLPEKSPEKTGMPWHVVASVAGLGIFLVLPLMYRRRHQSARAKLATLRLRK